LDRKTENGMKTLDEQMAVYAAYHRNRWNRFTHFIGVPAIIFAILIPMSWVSFGDGVTLAHVFVGVVLAYYFLLDVPLALAATVAVAALLLEAKAAAGTGIASGWIWFGVFFVGGWILQLVGHVFEGRRPALSDNLFQIFIAPIFLVAELFFALGLKRDVLEKIEARLAG
jgi:uncharacterized membrane protein YGL010W